MNECAREGLRPCQGLATRLRQNLKVPVMAAPMFIASTPDLVVAQSRSGIVGSIPALNARSSAELDADLTRIERGLEGCQVPYAINLVAHKSNERLEADLELTIKHRVPIVVLALAASAAIVDAIHGYGGIVLNDVINGYISSEAAEREYGVVVRYQGSQEQQVRLPHLYSIDEAATKVLRPAKEGIK